MPQLASRADAADATVTDFQARENTSELPYRLFVPDGYDDAGNASTTYPLVIFLHGDGQRHSGVGSAAYNTNQLSGAGGAPLILVNDANRTDHPLFLMAPQLSQDPDWGWGSIRGSIIGYIDDLKSEFRIDPDRVYVTGLSLGGEGTYALIQNNNLHFAAAAPMSGRGENTADKIAVIDDFPIWNFHGANDNFSGFEAHASNVIVGNIREAGGRPVYTRYPGLGHGENVWTGAYNEPLFLPWLLSQVRGQVVHSLFDITFDGVSNDTIATSEATVDLSGTASTSYGPISKIDWYSTTIASGQPGHKNSPVLATGTTTWSIQDIPVTSGTDTVVVRAYTDNGTTFSRTVDIVPGSGTNAAPSVDAGADFSLTMPNNQQTLEGSFSDDGLPAGGTVTTVWTQVFGPATVSFDDMHAEDPVATFPVEGSYELELTVSDGELQNSDSVSVLVNPAAVDGWIPVDIGGPLSPGSTTESAGVYTLSGSGYILNWRSTDKFHFAYSEISGDFQLTAQVTSFGSESWNGKSFVMARESLTPGAPFFMENIYKHGVTSGWRDTANTNPGSDEIGGPLVPYWIRIERSGDDFTGYYSVDGVSWTPHFSRSMPNMPDTLYVGMGLTADDYEADVATATFENVTLAVPNEAPVVYAGADQSTMLPDATVTLEGVVNDDGLPDGTLSPLWESVAGSGTVSFVDATDPLTEASFDTAGDYTLRLSVSDGDLSSFDEMSVFVGEADAQEWFIADIGAPALPGGFNYDVPTETLTLSGSGRMMSWFNDDKFFYFYREVTGDFSLTAHMSAFSSTSYNGKSLLMMRETEDADARMFAEGVNKYGILNLIRDPAGTGFVSDRFDGPDWPYWVRVERSGDTFSGWYSADGTNWTEHNSVTMDVPDMVFVGVAVTPDSDGQMATATISDLIMDGNAVGNGSVNSAPVVNAGPDYSAQLPDASLELSATVSDDGLPSGSSIALSWSQVSGPGTVSFSDTGAAATVVSFDVAGDYVLRLSASDGDLTGTDELSVTVEPDPDAGSGGSAAFAYSATGDVGTPGATGSITGQAGSYTLTGSGEIEVWLTQDLFSFAYEQISGDFVLSAHIASYASQTWNGRAFLMARESLDPGSPFFMESIFKYGAVCGYRDAPNTNFVSDKHDGPNFPYWVRIERIGDTFNGYYSADGVNWTFHASQTLALPDTLYVGMGVTTSDTGSQTATATFENVELGSSAVVDPNQQEVLLHALDNTRVPGTSSWRINDLSMSVSEASNERFGSNSLTLSGNATQAYAKGDAALTYDIPAGLELVEIDAKLEPGSNLISAGIQVNDAEGETLVATVPANWQNWKRLIFDLTEPGFVQAYDQSDKNGTLDLPITSISFVWYTAGAGSTSVAIDGLVGTIVGAPVVDQLDRELLPLDVVDDGGVAAATVMLSNPSLSARTVEIEYHLQHDSALYEVSPPDPVWGEDEAVGDASWTEQGGVVVNSGTLTDGDDRTTQYFADGSNITEADQFIDLGETHQVGRIGMLPADANKIRKVDVLASTDGVTYTPVAGLQGLDWNGLWGYREIFPDAPFAARYVQFHYHDDGNVMGALSLPNTMELFDGALDEDFAYPQIGTTVDSGSVLATVPPRSFATVQIPGNVALSSGAYLMSARDVSGPQDDRWIDWESTLVLPAPMTGFSPDSPFGINSSADWLADWNEKLGVGWVRFENLKWPMVSPAPDQFAYDGSVGPWHVDMDQYVETYVNRGISVLPYLFQVPEFASSAPVDAVQPKMYPPSDYNEYGKFVFQTVARYGSQTHPDSALLTDDKLSGLGYMDTYELWNEPNLNAPDWGHWIGPYEEYLEMFKIGATAAKQADPNILVSNAGLAGTDLLLVNQFVSYEYADGTRPIDYMDVLNVHHYTQPAYPEVATVNTNIDRSGNTEGAQTFEENLLQLNDWRNLHNPGMEIWLTETGFDVGGPRGVSLREQAALTPRNVLMILGAGVEKVFVFREMGSAPYLYGGSGVLSNDSRARPSFQTYATLIRVMDGATGYTRLPHPNDNVRLYGAMKNGQPVIAAWAVDGEESIDMDFGSATVTDAFGHASQQTVDASYTLGIFPIYMEDLDTTLPDQLFADAQARDDARAALIQAQSDLKAYLFDFGQEETGILNLGYVRHYTPVGFDDLFADNGEYGFDTTHDQRSFIYHGWISDAVDSDGVKLEPNPVFTVQADPGTYRVSMHVKPLGQTPSTVTLEGAADGVPLSDQAFLGDEYLEFEITVGTDPVDITIGDVYTQLYYITFVEVMD